MTTRYFQGDETYVYCIKAGEYYIIGITNNINDRLSMINSCNPINAELVGLATFANRRLARESEKSLHKFLTDKNVKGEWFLLSKEDVYMCFGEFE